MAYDSSDKPGSNELDRNPDPITGAPGSHPLGTGIGTGSGALTGAAIGSIGGPVGAAIGLIAGGIVGAFTGHAAGEYNDPTEDYSRPGDHTDPVAAATNPKATAPVTTSGKPATSTFDDRGMPASSTGSTGSTTSDTSGKSMVGSTGGATSARSAAATLDATDAEYYRSNHSKAAFAGESDDFDNDFAPAYGFGDAVSKQHATMNPGKPASIEELEPDLRAGWDHVKGTSKLTYDQAKPAINEAFNRTIRLHEERLNVGKERVETGNVSLRKEIVTEQKTIQVPVEREEIVITTTNLTGQAADGATIGENQTIRVPVSEERVNVTKDVVPTGEVRLDKKIVQDTKTVVDNIRKETVKVEKTGDVRVDETTGTGSK